MPIIEAIGLTKTYRVFQKKDGLLGALKGLYHREYKAVRAVDNVSFSIEPGEMVAFLGPNGAGKTTTLKMLSGLIYPASGSAQVLGFTPWDRRDAFRRQFALVMGQKNQLWWDLPASDSFQLHREIYSLPADEFNRTLGELTELLGVEKLTRQAVRELSLGERMKMELIAALLHQPRLLLLDEPTIGLDVVAQVAIQKCLKEYHARRGVTMLLTSHYMRDVEALCRRVLVITNGKLVYDGELTGLTERFGDAKLVKLEFADGTPEGLERFGEVTRKDAFTADLKIERLRISEVMGAILDRHAVADLSVQDPPLEQVIAKVFQEGGTRMTPPETIEASDVSQPVLVETPASRAGGLAHTIRKYAKIFRASLVERLTYRADFLFGTLLRFLPMLTTILLWQAIYASAAGDATSSSGHKRLSFFDFNEMIAYLLLVNISRMFSSMPGLAGGIARDIREGSIKKYLLQPVDLIGYLLSYRIAHKASYIISSALPYALLFYICRRFFYGHVPHEPVIWAGFLASLVLAFAVGFFFEASMGMAGFWFMEVTSLLYIVMTLNFFVSGHMFPLDLLPRPWSTILKSLPFQYMAYFPAVIFLGKVRGSALAFGLLLQLFWAGFFVLLARWLYRRGLRRYSAFGG